MNGCLSLPVQVKSVCHKIIHDCPGISVGLINSADDIGGVGFPGSSRAPGGPAASLFHTNCVTHNIEPQLLA